MFKLQMLLALLLTIPAFGLSTVDQAYLAKGGKNWIKNGGAEQARTGWATYADAAGTSPVDCTGGSATNTWTVSTTTPLSETASFVYTHAASNRQGDGVSYLFAIDKAEQGRQQQVSFDYEVASGTFVAGVNPIGGVSAVESDLEVYLYDVTNASFIDLSNKRLLGGSGAQQKFIATFQTAAASTSYRLCLHSATTATAASTLRIDSVKVGPQIVTIGTPSSDSVSYTATLTNAPTMSTATTKYFRSGESMFITGYFVSSGTGAGSAITVSLPPGYAIDTNKLAASTGIGSASRGSGGFNNGSNTTALVPSAASSTTLSFVKTGGSSLLGTDTTSGTTFGFDAWVPILGWTSGSLTAQAGDDTRTIVMSAKQASTTSVTSSATTIVYDTVIVDTHGGLNTSTGVYTVSSAGLYAIDFLIYWTSSTAQQYYEGQILAGGVSYLVDEYWKDYATSKEVMVPGHLVVSLKAGDTIAVKGRCSVSTTSTLAGSFFSVARIGGGAQLTAADTIAARYTSTSTAAQSSSDAIINYDTKDYDTVGMVTTGASWKATAPIPGKYRVTARVETSNTGCTSTSSHLTLSVYKNGSRSQVTDDRICGITGGYRKTVAGSVELNMIAGDYVDVRFSVSDATTHSIAAFSTDNITAVEVVRVGN